MTRPADRALPQDRQGALSFGFDCEVRRSVGYPALALEAALAIREDGVSAVSVRELLDQNLQIPNYQRPYSWEPATALQLVDDVLDSMEDPDRSDAPYVLGAIILYVDRLREQNGERLEIVDGQQRLLTLRMIVAILDSDDALAVTGGTDTPVVRVWSALRRRLAGLSDEVRLDLLGFVRDGCQLVRVVTDDVDEAFRVFDSQNYRGKPLAPHDLLKAHHLREMRDETPAMKAAVVETWESVRDEDLDRLFSTYLYRISCWSRGESARGFTVHDIGTFKGISPRASLSPSSRYHVSAQAARSLLDTLGASSALRPRDAGRSRFQLDAPVLAGRPFFEMVTFLLDELKMLAREGFSADTASFSFYHLDALVPKRGVEARLEERQSRSRYRYVCELYLAALLYYTNRFGDDDLDEARTQLFAWAYGLRVERLRVQFRSVDNRGRGEDSSASAFILLRNASTGRVVSQLPTAAVPYNDRHEARLVQLLQGEAAS